MKMPKSTDVRLNKFISSSGICSRREADKLIDSGRIKVNDEKAILGTKINEGDKITIDNKIIEPKKMLLECVLTEMSLFCAQD